MRLASRQRCAAILILGFSLLGGLMGPRAAAAAEASSEAVWAALDQGAIILFRHAIAPGGGDPPGMRLDACDTQRNLDETGRAQAARIGAAFRARQIAVGRVLTSQWCRTRETAAIAFPGQPIDAPAFNSFYGAPAKGPEQTAAARAILAAWRGPGALVVVTHQVNITALTGIVPRSGEGVVIAPVSDDHRPDGPSMLRPIGRVTP